MILRDSSQLSSKGDDKKSLKNILTFDIQHLTLIHNSQY